MSIKEQHILDAALALPPDRRLAIAESIYDSLSSNNSVDAAHLQEAEARLDAFYLGNVETVPADEVLKEFLELDR